MSYPQRSWDDGDVEVVAKRLWAGGVATALVAAGIAFVGVLIINSIFEVGIQTAGRSGALVDNASTVIPIAAGIAALASTALLHLLLMTTPRPASFFSAIAVLVIVVLILQVFLADGVDLGAHRDRRSSTRRSGSRSSRCSPGSRRRRCAPRPGAAGAAASTTGSSTTARYDAGYGTHEPQSPYPPQSPYGQTTGTNARSVTTRGASATGGSELQREPSGRLITPRDRVRTRRRRFKGS